ncbi:hypothetical protein R6Q59_007256 [Mikania micrantha]
MVLKMKMIEIRRVKTDFTIITVVLSRLSKFLAHPYFSLLFSLFLKQEVFHKELVKEYRSNNDENLDRDEFVVWERLHPNGGGPMFGVGSSNPRFVVTGS